MFFTIVLKTNEWTDRLNGTLVLDSIQSIDFIKNNCFYGKIEYSINQLLIELENKYYDFNNPRFLPTFESMFTVLNFTKLLKLMINM